MLYTQKCYFSQSFNHISNLLIPLRKRSGSIHTLTNAYAAGSSGRREYFIQKPEGHLYCEHPHDKKWKNIIAHRIRREWDKI